MHSALFILSVCVAFTNAHMAAWADGMYCRNGAQLEDDQNAQAPVSPLYMMTKEQWWFHHYNGCDEYPPPDGEFLEIPAGQNFTVEIAPNRATTTLSYGGIYTSEWTDGNTYPDGFYVNNTNCISDPNLHAQNESMAAGTAFAISYVSELSEVTPENLVVFTIRYHTPWRRLTTYDVPADLPACPTGGCMCAWGWVANGCGEPNFFQQGFKCNVTGATSTTPVAAATPAVWCEDDPSKCTQGAKQMVYWNQLEGNNIEVDGNDLSGNPKSPTYNQKLGFADGAQNDIFVTSGSSSSTVTSDPSVSATSPTVLETTSTAVLQSKPSTTPMPLSYHKHSSKKRGLAAHGLSRLDSASW